MTVHKRYNNYKEIKKFVKKLLKKDKYKSLIVTCDDKKELLRVQGKKAFSEKGPSNQWIWNTKPYIGISKKSDDNCFSERIIYISVYAEDYNRLVLDELSIQGSESAVYFEPLDIANYSNNGTLVTSVAQYYVPNDSIELYSEIVTDNYDPGIIAESNGSFIVYSCSSKDRKFLKALHSFYKEVKEYL